MRVWLGVIFIATSGILFAQYTTRQKSPHSPVKTFTSPDGAFRLTFSNLLTQCEKRPQGEEYVWEQQECSAYYPTCEAYLDLAPQKDVIVCFAYPRNKHTDTPTFEAATFSVGIAKVSGRADCLSPKLSQIDKKKGAVRIGPVTFLLFETAEAAMSQGGSADVLRTFHAGRCYELVTSNAWASPGAFDPPPREMTKEDGEEVSGKLNQARDSFRFLK